MGGPVVDNLLDDVLFLVAEPGNLEDQVALDHDLFSKGVAWLLEWFERPVDVLVNFLPVERHNVAPLVIAGYLALDWLGVLGLLLLLHFHHHLRVLRLLLVFKACA